MTLANMWVERRSPNAANERGFDFASERHAEGTEMASDLGTLSVRLALPSDRPALRAAVVELHEEERRLHDSRLPGEQTADAYLVWMLAEAARDGAVFVAEAGGVFAGFAAGCSGERD
jgi:hypothetical protein